MTDQLCRKSTNKEVQFEDLSGNKLHMANKIKSTEESDCEDNIPERAAGKLDQLAKGSKRDKEQEKSLEKVKKFSVSDELSRKRRLGNSGDQTGAANEAFSTVLETDQDNGPDKDSIRPTSVENTSNYTKSRLRKKIQAVSEEGNLGSCNQHHLNQTFESAQVPSCGIGAETKNCLFTRADDTQLEKRVLAYQDAPSYLKFNPYITGGYRSMLTPRQCVYSLFWWTNETLNIWSHLLGWVLFLCLSVQDAMRFFSLPTTHPWDRAIMAVLLVSFQACMLLSALYHVFCCCSERYYRRWLTADLFGVSLSLLAVYISGIYYAFSCVPFWLSFYLITVAAIFLAAVVLQILPVVHKSGSTTAKAFHGRLIVFGGWAAYGIVPTVHWALLHGGMSSPIVALILPRIFMMYGITAVAFFFYVLRLPEKLYPGLVNFIGSSHQLWHILIVVAFYHWHNTGLLFLQFRASNSCVVEYEFLFPSIEEDTVVLH